MKTSYILSILFFIFYGTESFSQSDPFDYKKEMFLPNADYYDIVKRGVDYYDAHPEFQNEEDGEAQEFYRWVNFWKNRVGTLGNNHGSFLPSSLAFQNLITDPVCDGSPNVQSDWTG